MNKFQNLYGISPEQNEDQTIHQLKFALAVKVGAVYFTVTLSLVVETESYLTLTAGVITERIKMIMRKS